VLAPGSRRRARAIVATAATLRYLQAAADLGALEPRVVETDDLDALVGTREHQGVGVLVPAFRYAELDDLYDAGVLVVLDEVIDPRNVGAVARSVLASGAGGVVLPARRAAAVTAAAVKASAGATEHVPIAQVTNVVAALKQLKAQGYWVYGTAADAELSYRELDYGGRVALVLGSEGKGLRPLAARTCDALAAIPVAPPMDSLNVSVAAALFLYEAQRFRAAAAAARPRYPARP
jgi:23S rRNA (guanosine2251-2'-O)-methyltransferase